MIRKRDDRFRIEAPPAHAVWAVFWYADFGVSTTIRENIARKAVEMVENAKKLKKTLYYKSQS